ncbi:NACHT domain-containing protein [Candidatus Leptofilum sp.]|uniref:NACHT domain-containing protein n=1 Tax=Candidatus Leptofilum sp. TaxID=3241576 RepID=UPI003B5944AA
MSLLSLPDQISHAFSLDELRSLCFDLNIRYESLRGETIDDKALALVLYCERRSLTDQLLAICAEKRPSQTWSRAQFQPASDAVRQKYVAHLQNRYQYLDFRGMGPASEQPIRLPLDAVYVPLNGRINRTLTRDHNQPPPIQPLLTLLQQKDGLIVLGNPGSGKTTWLKYLAHQLASGHGEQLGLGNRLPLVLSLSAYATALAGEDMPLPQFLADFYQAIGFDAPLDGLFQTTLAAGNALLLLDGLDEITDPALRHLVSSRLLDLFTIQRQNGNKFVITSRPAGYQGARLLADGLLECTVVPLDHSQIEQFVRQWTAVLTPQDSPKASATQQNRLLTLLDENTAVQELASIPLLLTILLLLQRQGTLLPQKRIALYDLYLHTLLLHWQTGRSLDRPPQNQFSPEQMLQLLPPLALWMHETSPQRSQVPTAALQQQLTALLADQDDPAPSTNAATFLQMLQTITGLMISPAPNTAGFLHLTFQEYAAALALANLADETDTVPLLAAIQARLTDLGWHEVILLTLGIVAQVQFRPNLANQILQQLLAEANPAEDGETMLLLGETAVLLHTDLSEALQTAVPQALVHTTTTVRRPASQRVQAGQLLGQLGDPRADVLTLEQALFCYVPGGSFWLGRADEATLYNGLPNPYWISQFPVTQAQFTQFVAAGGYSQPELWPEAAAVNRWRPGEVQDWAQRGWRAEPFAYGRPFNLPNHPIVGITWFEALAFTRWLTQHWRDSGVLLDGWQVQLPTEVAWEKAARGGLQIPQWPMIVSAAIAMENPHPTLQLTKNPAPQRPYPGQTSLTPQTANVNETAVATSSAVGCFPQPSPVGCQEMCGNVWEWTGSRFRPFPYDPADGREDPDVKLYEEMVLRGGAYWSDTRAANATFRARRSPNDQNSSYGFRLMMLKQR